LAGEIPRCVHSGFTGGVDGGARSGSAGSPGSHRAAAGRSAAADSWSGGSGELERHLILLRIEAESEDAADL